jgi:putative alpha-1,2-mannosidase
MPQAGEAKLDPGDPKVPGSGYRSRFSHSTEVAHPGYYAVTLADSNIRAEMTTGTRVGVHRYTFQPGAHARLVIDLRSSLYNYPGKVLWSGLHLHPDGTLTGFRETRGWAPGRKLFFAMRFSAPLVGHELIDRDANVPYRGFKGPGRTSRLRKAGQGAGGLARFRHAAGPAGGEGRAVGRR